MDSEKIPDDVRELAHEIASAWFPLDYQATQALTAAIATAITSDRARRTDKAEPVGYVTPETLQEVTQGNIGAYIFPKGTLRPGNEVPLFASPIPPAGGEMVLVPRDDAEFVTNIANRNEYSLEGARLALLLATTQGQGGGDA